MFSILEAQRHFLSDERRLAAYREALREVVRDGHVVLDLGAGTAVMGLLACRAGAARVYAVEATGLIAAARAICRRNGFADRVIFLRGMSTELELPERVDVVVTDQINEFCFGAGLLEFLSDAGRRFLRPGGVLVPARVDLLVAPVESASAWEMVDFWRRPIEDLDFSDISGLAANTMFTHPFASSELLADPMVGASVETGQSPEHEVAVEAVATVSRDGALHGLGGFFAAHLSPGVVMSNDPNAPHPIRRNGAFFPLEWPIDVRRGDEVVLRLRVTPAESLYTWWLTVRRSMHGVDGRSGQALDEVASVRGSTFVGQLISSEDLDKSRPGRHPRLTPRALARLTVLELCRGGATVAEIESEVAGRHPQLFESPAAVARFVSEIVDRSCR
jgi:protein arginine N-methyltransferase 1